MTIDAATSGAREYTVEGSTFSPYGSVKLADGTDASTELKADHLQRLAEIGSICNDAKIVYNNVSLPQFPREPSLTPAVGEGHVRERR